LLQEAIKISWKKNDSEGKNPNSEKTKRTNKNVRTLIIREKTLTVAMLGSHLYM
jgi:hypothetical protein